MKRLVAFLFSFACLTSVQASWYWPFGDDGDEAPKRLSELMEPASLLIDDASDCASEGKVDDAVEKYRAALKELDRIEAENPERAKTTEFATLRTKRAYVSAAIDSMLLNQARQNALTVAVSDTTDLERRLAEEKAAGKSEKASDQKKPLVQDEKQTEAKKVETAAKKVETAAKTVKPAAKKVKSAAKKPRRPARELTPSEQAMVAIREKDFATADRIIAQLLVEKPNGSLPLNLRAMREMAGGDLRKAESTLDQAIQSNPRDYVSYYNMAIVLLESNAENVNGARRYYETGRAMGGPVDAELEKLVK